MTLSDPRTPEQIVEDFCRTATTVEHRMIADMIETYKKRVAYWESKAKSAASPSVTKVDPFEPFIPSDG